MAALIAELSQRYSHRVVLFDTPPILSTSEAAVLAPLMGQVICVVEADKTPQRAVIECVRALAACRSVGLVLNKASKRATVLGYYGYGDYRY